MGAIRGARAAPQPGAAVHGARIQFDEIVALMRQRRSMDSKLIEAMIEIRDRYNGDVVTPLPDVAGREGMTRPGPNFIQEAIDGLARRANSMLPRIACPPAGDSAAEEARAVRRRDALEARWYSSELDLKLFRAFRHLAGYGTCALVAMPDDGRGHATVELRDPITAYPELRAPDDIRPPKNVGFLYARSIDWIAANYPHAQDFFRNAAGRNWDTLWDVVEWIDEHEIVVGIMGPRMPAYGYNDSRPYGYTAYELARWPNRAAMCPVVVPRRVTLDRIIGQLTALIGYTDQYARLMSLAIVADEKATFPDIVVMSRDGMPPQLVNGRWMDGRSGEVNLLTNAVVEVVGKTPGPSTLPMLQATEEAIRSSSGASPLFGGNVGGMGRTGAALSTLGGYSIDPHVQEAQMIMARSLAALNEGIMAVEEGYFGDSTFTCVLGLRGSQRSVTYRPGVDFRYKGNVVNYPFPGADINALSVALAQKVSTKMMSRTTARHLDPMIDDPEQEESLVNAETGLDALRDQFATAVAQGQLPLPVAARVITLTNDGVDLPDAILQATAEAASQGPAPGSPEAGSPPGGSAGPTGPSGQPIPPALAQMLASQGGGPQVAPGAQMPAAPPDLMNFRHVVQGLNENISKQAV